MILIENTQMMGLEPTIRGMRNPMNSWAKSDSGPCATHGPDHCIRCSYSERFCSGNVDDINGNYIVGPNDLDLMLRLAKAGSVDGKFRRMITVYVDLTAPLYWWKEFDTYKVGTVANSCSTMHKIHSKPFVIADFSHEHLIGEPIKACDEVLTDPLYVKNLITVPTEVLEIIVATLNNCREQYLKTKDKKYWWQMIQLLPSSYNQKRTVMLNYEVLSNIYQHRRSHKLDEWRELCRWIEGLPYSEVITCNTERNK